MSTKHTFWTLCNEYNKIEVPIIQRDYAQGRETPEVERIRRKFINDYLISSLLEKNRIELDFVYGSVLTSGKNRNDQEIFIPLDGQQRLTTLFLLHWFITLKEDRIEDAKQNLLKFTYETRPSAHDFCNKLIEKHSSKNLINLKSEIINSEWYDDEWDHDPTISGMLTMLNTFSESEQLLKHEKPLFDSLISIQDPLISFYFIPLEKFGLTENLYIRMNARGKILTSFENFKSEFYKTISNYHDLFEEVKDKIEYAWVENLWEYRAPDSFIIDKPFMQYLSFITEMLFFKEAKFRADAYPIDFLDFKLLGQIYTDKENLKFLIFAFDALRELKEHNQQNILWTENSTIHDIINSIIVGRHDTTQVIVLYSALVYYSRKKEKDLYDFLRVVRNLIHNTTDNSRREWPKLLKSINNLIKEESVYKILLDSKNSDLLDGFYVPQRKEEIFKAKLIEQNPTAKEILFIAEDNEYLKGNITSLLIANFISKETELTEQNLLEENIPNFKLRDFSALCQSYKSVSVRSFDLIWGDLLNSSLYSQSQWSRLTYSYDYVKHPSVIFLAKAFSKSGTNKNLEDFLILKEKKFVSELLKKHPDLSTTRNVKEQLYLYYIIHRRILNKGYGSFFKSGFNFGWLAKQKGFTSLFRNGIEGDHWFKTTNPIFQTYNTQFRYNLGLNLKNALDEEIVSVSKKRKLFELLSEWAKE